MPTKISIVHVALERPQTPAKEARESKNARKLTTEENEELLRLAAEHKKQHRGKEAVCWKEVHTHFSARGDFTKVQLRSRWEVLTQTSTSTARARQCNATWYGGGPAAPIAHCLASRPLGFSHMAP